MKCFGNIFQRFSHENARTQKFRTLPCSTPYIAMALGVNQLKRGSIILYEDQPYEVNETHHLRMQQRRPVVNTRLTNLITGTAIERNFKQSDVFDEADIEKKTVVFLYNHRDDFVFHEKDKSEARFNLSKAIISDKAKWLKPNTVVQAVAFNEKIISITIPIKMELKVVEAPPGIKGDTAQGGTKAVTLETGAIIQAPLFIQQDDIIIVNTESEEYVERGKKA
ncbi:MAG: elongation factor P [Patescibacteria group bacterium]